MTKDEFVQKYLNCNSEAEKALLVWDMCGIQRAAKLDEELKKGLQHATPQVCPSPFAPLPLPTAPYPSDNFNDLLKRYKIYC